MLLVMMLVVLVSAGWSWLLSPCGVGVEAGGVGVAAGGGGAAGAPPRKSQTKVWLDTISIYIHILLDIA